MKIITRENFRVIVYPERGYTRDPDKEDAEILCKEIKRHCDIDRAEVDWDVKETCSFCGRLWEEDDAGGGRQAPCCCHAAYEEWSRSRALALVPGETVR